MTGLIRWEPNDYGTGYLGYVGTRGEWLFQIWRSPVRAEEWELKSTLPGHSFGGKVAWADDPEPLKRRAGDWLREFVASIGAVLPEPGASRLTDEHGTDRGLIIETSWQDSADPELACYVVYVKEG